MAGAGEKTQFHTLCVDVRRYELVNGVKLERQRETEQDKMPRWFRNSDWAEKRRVQS